MANEKKTERVVREHFSAYEKILHIEEQISDSPKIRKLLKGASKTGRGAGYPEFVISYKANADLLIVVECKADGSKHESKTQDKFKDYAVDGALLYASYLAKDFDVVAIAVSGETKRALKVSHFLHLKGEKKAVPFFGDALLPAGDYLSGYLNSDEKFRQDYDSLLLFAKQLNQKLHTHKIAEKDRSLLISAVLIALENDAFKRSYPSHHRPKDLASSLVETVFSELETADISGEKLQNLKAQFGFIKTDTSLSQKENVLKEIIRDINDNVNQFIKTHEFFDVLGQLYIEFLNYANSDKGLGIVLTPPHITEFFSDLARVNKESVVYDNCTGTGGFLISAMKKMVDDAHKNSAKIKKIKTKQLFGTEYQAHIFALTVSNMYIHQDGKTNIVNGDCFDEKIVSEIRTKKPTVGFLNPPYKANKKTDTEELAFVLNNLECLVDGGTCVAILPMQSALGVEGEVLRLKQKLLEKHTLEAVLSMPDELFFNSDVSVVSCVMVFAAHKPHPVDKKTYFGYYKDDGFVKRKNKGRIDALGKWQGIKADWLSGFINRQSVPGFSVNKKVTAEMEWAAEAYMETDYSALTAENFEEAVLDHVIFLHKNKINRG